MANFWDSAPLVSPFDAALQLEGITGPKADLARSIYAQESGSGANTQTSNAGAVGGMQIIPSTFASVADEGWDINDPVQNARAGLRYINQLWDTAGGDPKLTAIGYYGGPGAISKARKGVAVSDPRNPNAPNTLQYGDSVVSRMAKLGDKVAQAIFPAAEAGELPEEKWWEAAPLADQDEDKWWEAAPLVEEEDNSLADNPLVALGAGLGEGFGRVALGAQDYLGKGLSAIGAEGAGDWLSQDAEQGREKLSKELAPYKKASPISSTVGQIGGNIVAINPLLRAAGAAVAGSGLLPSVARPVGSAIATSGLRSAGVGGKAGLAAKTAGGAIAGGIGAGLVDPKSAGTGALIGGALPGVWGGSARVTGAAAKLLRGPEVPAATRNAVQMARSAGYVVPPSQAKPTLTNRVLEGTAGKLTTAQNASARNQAVTNRLAQSAIGVAEDTPLTPDVLQGVRKQAGDFYQTLRSVGSVKTDDKFLDALAEIEAKQQGAGLSFPGLKDNGVVEMVESLRVPQFAAGSAIDAIAVLRERADKAYRAGDNTLGKAAKDAAKALEEALGRAVEATGRKDLLDAFRSARQQIAKTYSIQKAANPETGSVNAQKLAGELMKGRPLSGELRQIAQTASAFPKAMQPVERMGSLPGLSPLDIIGSTGLSVATQNPFMMLTLLGRPLARSAILSSPVQNRLATQAATQANQPLLTGGLLGLGFRGAPLLSSGQ